MAHLSMQLQALIKFRTSKDCLCNLLHTILYSEQLSPIQHIHQDDATLSKYNNIHLIVQSSDTITPPCAYSKLNITMLLYQSAIFTILYTQHDDVTISECNIHHTTHTT